LKRKIVFKKNQTSFEKTMQKKFVQQKKNQRERIRKRNLCNKKIKYRLKKNQRKKNSQKEFVQQKIKHRLKRKRIAKEFSAQRTPPKK
jgi:hypothetical protein